MSSEISLAAVIGSLRKQSLTRAVFNMASEVFQEHGVEISEIPLDEVPLYNGDIEAAGDPPSVVELKRAVENSHGLVIFTPEYNRSTPAVTKNAVDWLSRPYGRGPLTDKPVGIVAQSPGGHDAPGVRAHLSVSVSANTNYLFEETLGVARSSSANQDEAARQVLADWCRRFTDHVREIHKVHV